MTSSDADFQLHADSQLFRAARSWADMDPDPATSSALNELVALAEAGTPAARQQLQDSFSGPLQFGTAGLRAALGPGPNRMNRVVGRLRTVPGGCRREDLAGNPATRSRGF
jgi:phosphomannomutase